MRSLFKEYLILLLILSKKINKFLFKKFLQDWRSNKMACLKYILFIKWINKINNYSVQYSQQQNI